MASLPGTASTAFGVPDAVSSRDTHPLNAQGAARLAALVEGAWAVLESVAANAPAALRKGPRGGGRDRDKVVAHVVSAEASYARRLGLRIPEPAFDDRPAIEAGRVSLLDVLRRPSDGQPLVERGWPARYAARRIAWHALDHAWEIEDRSEPAG